MKILPYDSDAEHHHVFIGGVVVYLIAYHRQIAFDARVVRVFVLLLLRLVDDQRRERDGYDCISLLLDGKRRSSASCKALVQDRVFGKPVKSLCSFSDSR